MIMTMMMFVIEITKAAMKMDDDGDGIWMSLQLVYDSLKNYLNIDVPSI